MKASLRLEFENQKLNTNSKGLFLYKQIAMKDDGYKIRDEFGVYYLRFQ